MPKVEGRQMSEIHAWISNGLPESGRRQTVSVLKSTGKDEILLRFGPFELSSRERVLKSKGRAVPLGSRALDILIYLAARPGQVIANRELIDHIWPGVTVEEGSIRVHVAAIRKALSDGDFGSRYIANVKGRGYSFVGSVVVLDGLAGNRERMPQYQGRIPARSITLIGRDAAISEVCGRVRSGRFVTLLGPGGIGKTAVARAVGHAVNEEFENESYFMDLGRLTEPHHVMTAVANSLGLAFNSESPASELIELIGTRKRLIIFDNCEHVIETVASLVEQLFQKTQAVHILSTSRESLNVEGEQCYRITPLEFPPEDEGRNGNVVLQYPAVQLLAERVAARVGRPVITDKEAPLAASICRQLDGFPLEIELAAGSVATLGLQNTADLLLSRAELLKLSRRTAVGRHRTLKSNFDWSYERLSDAEKFAFRRLAPFAGHFTMDDARHVSSSPTTEVWELFNAVAGLVEKSLIAVRIDAVRAQYRMSNTGRAYAHAKLEEHKEVDLAFGRHAEYFARHLVSLKENLSTLPVADRATAYSDLLSNVRVALEWSFGPHGNIETAMKLAATSRHIFMELSLPMECHTWAGRAVARMGQPTRAAVHAMKASTVDAGLLS